MPRISPRMEMIRPYFMQITITHDNLEHNKFIKGTLCNFWPSSG